MAETVIKKNESIIPFIGGLDALGQQITSEATFTFLMPGLNNVTGRQLYYSFYCWLLDAYSEHVGSTAPSVYQTFLRKADYLVALDARLDPADDKKKVKGKSELVKLRNHFLKKEAVMIITQL